MSDPFYKLTPAELKQDWQNGLYRKASHVYLHHIIKTLRRDGWWWSIESVDKFCTEWEIPRSTFYRAKAKLVSLGILEENIRGQVDLRLKSPTNGTENPTSGTESLTSGTENPTSGTESLTSETEAPLKPLQSNASSDSTDLLQIYYRSTQHSVCSKNDLENSQKQVKPTSNSKNLDPNSKDITPNKFINTQVTELDKFSAPILQRAKKLGVNLNDQKLRSAIELYPNRVEQAIECLEEKQRTVKYPTRFLQRALEEDWRPEKGISPGNWREWFDEAYRRGLVKASQIVDEVLHVLTVDDHWVPFDQLRQQNWEELEAQLKPVDVVAAVAVEALSTEVVPAIGGM